MPYQTRQVWVDDRSGPNAFESVRLFNQRLWDNEPGRADQNICDVLAAGGFGEDEIRRQVGKYEGQIMAIRRGLVDKQEYGYRINDVGRDFLRHHGKAVAEFLPVIGGWHGSEAQYCMYETNFRGEPALRFAEKLIPQGQSLCMNPLFRKQDAAALRDYLSTWLSRI